MDPQVQVKILPVLHRNGTGASSLYESYLLAHDALARAAEAFDKIEFNPRDYYCHPTDGAYVIARDQRIEMAKSMKQVEQYLFRHLEHISDYVQG